LKIAFAWCNKNTRQRSYLPSVKKTLDKETICWV
jgi:hypothetical protein